MTIEILEELIKGANTAAAAAAASDEVIGTVFISSNNAGVVNSGSVNGIAKGIRWIVEVAYGAAEKKIENKVGSNAAGTGNEDAGKLFSGGGDKDAARKAVAAVSAVSGDQILHTIVSAARNGNVDVGSVSDELNISGKDAQSAKNPIEAAIGVNSVSNSNQAFSKIKRNDEIATAIVLRGMAKEGRFFASDNAASDVKQSAQLSILKTVTALADLVKGVVKECLDRIVKILEEEDHNKAHTVST
ncbi:variable large family protein (plasmid) [Borreliella turdi]|uniref:variable large family protein n=1 Tax=Borreliella turdi TaxID=57863 RepID=UPI003AF1C24D